MGATSFEKVTSDGAVVGSAPAAQIANTLADTRMHSTRRRKTVGMINLQERPSRHLDGFYAISSPDARVSLVQYKMSLGKRAIPTTASDRLPNPQTRGS